MVPARQKKKKKKKKKKTFDLEVGHGHCMVSIERVCHNDVACQISMFYR